MEQSSPISCKLCQRGLSAWMDREVFPGLAADIERHLASCPACEAERARLAALGQVLAALPQPPPVTGRTLGAVLERLEADSQRAFPWYSSPWGSRVTATLGGLACLTCLIFGIRLGDTLLADVPSLHPQGSESVSEVTLLAFQRTAFDPVPSWLVPTDSSATGREQP